MYPLVIGRAYPDKKTGMMGIFEFEQAEALRKYGLNTVYTFCDTRSIKSLRKLNYVSLISNDVPVYGYHLPIGGTPRKIFDKLKESHNKKLLKKLITKHGVPDIIHVHFPLLNLNIGIWEMLRSLKRPIVITEHWSKVQTKDIESFRVSLLKRVISEADVFICVSNLLKKSVEELTNCKIDIKVIPNMVKSHFYYEEKPKSEKFHFITIGRLVEVKRIGFVVEAFTKAFKNNKDIHLHIIGDGPQFNKIKSRINSLGMRNRITMHGFLSREETANLLRKSDAFVSASVLETFGVPFIEAMSCGKPVIGVENGPLDNYIVENKGALFKRDNLGSLINTMKIVYKNRNDFNGQDISDKSRRFFSERSVINELIEIYKEYIKQSGST